MQAAILAVGTELLGIDRLDTNSLLLTAALRRYGIQVHVKCVIGDRQDEIAVELGRLLQQMDLVLVTGGLGPTADDVTREAAAAALGRSLIVDEELLEDIRAKFREWRHAMPAVNARQAQIVEGAVALANVRGTAPGMRIQHEGATLFLFPGVPNELRGLIDSALTPWLREHSDGAELETRVLRVACIPESSLEERIRPAYEEFGAGGISVLASPGEVQIRLTVRGGEAERRTRLEAMTARVEELVGEALYAIGETGSLEQTVGEMLAARQYTLATAESCTGGLIARRLTGVAGSSRYFVGGVVTYSDTLKSRLLGVAAKTLETFGAVSREVAIEMAEGVIERLTSDFGIAVSGIAGPGGGTPDKPVGTVHVVVAERNGELVHRELLLPGGRKRVRWLASQWALDMLRRQLRAREVGP